MPPKRELVTGIIFFPISALSFFDGSFELDKAIISVTTPGYHCLF